MPSDLICEIKKTITKVVPDSIEVKDGGCPEGFNGNNPENIVNRLSTKDYRLNNLKKPANVTELISPMRSLMSLDL